MQVQPKLLQNGNYQALLSGISVGDIHRGVSFDDRGRRPSFVFRASDYGIAMGLPAWVTMSTMRDLLTALEGLLQPTLVG